MKNKIVLTIFLVIVSSSTSLIAHADLTRAQRVSDAQTMIALFEHRYAPIEWKKEFLGISFDKLASDLMAAVDKENVTDKEFYSAMSRVSGGVRDTHNWFIIPSNYMSKLGFRTDYIEGHVLIESVDREILPKNKFPFERGDELISIGGQPVEEIMNELAEITTEGNELTEKRFLAMDLSKRSQDTYPDIPTGETTLEIYSRARDTKENFTIMWKTSGSPLAPTGVETKSGILSFFKSLLPSSSNNSIDTSTKKTDKIRRPVIENLRWSAYSGPKGSRLGNINPFFPLWDTFVQRTEAPLMSGIFILNGKRIGFVRIHTWDLDDPMPWIDFLEREIPFLEKETDALVIDQTDNGGGLICLGNIVAGFFVSEQIQSNLFEIRANRHYLLHFESDVASCQKNEYKPASDCPAIFDIADKMRDAIEKGQVLTEPIPICSPDGKVHPHTLADGTKTVYTKPLLMLINEFSISVADMTLAFLQDSERAVMFGGRTCGAGGSVETTDRIGYSDFQISQTESLTVRPKAVVTPQGITTRYLENIGVVPDVEYPITVNDFINGYAGYRKAIEDTLMVMLKGK